MNTTENTLAQLQHVRGKGFEGTVFYSYRHPSKDKSDQENTFAAIRQNFQPEWTATPPLAWKKTKAIIKGTVTTGKGAFHNVKEQTPVPVYNALVTLNTDP